MTKTEGIEEVQYIHIKKENQEMKNITKTIILASAVTALAVLLLVGCHEGRNHEMRQQPANVDTLVFDEAYYERMWLFEAVEAGRCCRRTGCSPAGTRTSTLNGGITDQLWGGKVVAQGLQKP